MPNAKHSKRYLFGPHFELDMNSFSLKQELSKIRDHFRVAFNLTMKARLGAMFLFHSYANETIFHRKSFALSLAFIMRLTTTRK